MLSEKQLCAQLEVTREWHPFAPSEARLYTEGDEGVAPLCAFRRRHHFRNNMERANHTASQTYYALALKLMAFKDAEK